MTAAEMAATHGFSTVICGHIHMPQSRIIHTKKGPIKYLNSGDWVENCTSLEYTNGTWSIYRHPMTDASAKVAAIKDHPRSIVDSILNFYPS